MATTVGSESAFVDRASIGFAWRVLRNDPIGWGISLVGWVLFFAAPIPIGLLALAVFDRAPTDDDSVWLWLAALAGLEVGRWALLGVLIVQWHGCWVFWHTVPRLNIMQSLVADPGPVSGRLPGSSGEAVSRFRDDARDVAMVLDVWLDVVAASVTTLAAFVVLAYIDLFAALAIVAPVVAVLWFGHLLGRFIRQWRWDERRHTARVTDFLGEVFGGITAVKVSGAESAVVGRFDRLGAARAEAARRDQVGTQMFQTLSGVTANAGLGLALLAVVNPIRNGEISVGEVAVFTSYASVVATLPRIVGRYTIWRRQADVSVSRLGRLLPERSPQRAAMPVATYLRDGPPPFAPPPYFATVDRSGHDRLESLRVRGLAVDFEGGSQLAGVDLDVDRGQLVVVTGEVGSGKSLLLRGLLGLVPRSAGEIEWNGRRVDEPSVEMTPPRVAYVPQVPRLFSETLSDTVLLGLDGDRLDPAMWLACLDDDVEELSDGVLTRVGPKGVRLSGGQIQRTAAARAFARDPELLVIDDLSSALDVGTEARLWDRLFGERGRRTVLAVSHRPRVLEQADVVVELAAGVRSGDRYAPDR
jgi:ATP-binding cassette subfamily B protein